MAHSMYRYVTQVLVFPLPIKPSCFRSSSRPTMRLPARKVAPAWGSPYRSALLRCTAVGFGSYLSLAKARHSLSRFR